MLLGHQDQEQKNLCSTKLTKDETPKAYHLDQDIAPKFKTYTNIICSMIFPKDSLHAYSDPTGQFSIISSRVNLCIFVLYHYDMNTIHATAIPNRQAATSSNQGQTTCKHIMDYLHTHLKAVIHYHASRMILSMVSNSTYLVIPNARSCCATLYTLPNCPNSKPLVIKPNGTLHVLVKTIHSVPASGSQVETWASSLGGAGSCPDYHQPGGTQSPSTSTRHTY